MGNFEKIVALAGVSESGKSHAARHLAAKSDVEHHKIRDVFADVRGQMASDSQPPDPDSIDMWGRFITTLDARKRSPDTSIAVIDTLTGARGLTNLHLAAGGRLALLFITADEDVRVRRELNRLHEDSPYTDRRADLSISYDDVLAQTREKDARKIAAGLLSYLEAGVNPAGEVDLSGAYAGRGDLLTVIHNNGTLDEFNNSLDAYYQKLHVPQSSNEQ
jgi:hypothetical protein